MTTDQQPKGTHRWEFDKTLNLPTLITIGVVVVSITAFGFDVVSDRDQRIAAQARRIDAVERTAESAVTAVEQVKNVQTMQIKTQADQMQTLRTEFRSDLRDISNKLDALLMNSAGFRPGTKEWSK